MALFRRKSDDDEQDPEAVARWDAVQNMLGAEHEQQGRPAEPESESESDETPPWRQEPPQAEPGSEPSSSGWDSWDDVISSTSYEEAPPEHSGRSTSDSPAAGPEPEPERSDPAAGLISNGSSWNTARIVLPGRPVAPDQVPSQSGPADPMPADPMPADRMPEPVEPPARTDLPDEADLPTTPAEREQPAEPVQTWSAAPIADPGTLSWIEPEPSLRPDPRKAPTGSQPIQTFDLPPHARPPEPFAGADVDSEVETAQESAPPAEPPAPFIPQQPPMQPPPQQSGPYAPPPPAPGQWQQPPAQWQPGPPPVQPPPIRQQPVQQPPMPPMSQQPPTSHQPQWHQGPPPGPQPRFPAQEQPHQPWPSREQPAVPPRPSREQPAAASAPQPPETPPFVWTDDFESGAQPAVPGGQAHFAGPQVRQLGPRTGPSVDDLTAGALVERRSDAPRAGWRKAVYRMSAHAVNPGISRQEQHRRHLIGQATVPVHGCYRIAVISLKGGVGKTTTTVCLGATLASLRGDRVIAVDANPDRGTLSGKIPVQTTATVRNLLNDVDRVERYSDVRRYTSQSPDRLEVLASESDPSVSLAFSEEDYRKVAGVLERFYNVVLTDCGTGLLHSAMAGVLSMANQLVVVSSGSVDGARSASATIDWLEAHGYSRLVAGSVAVINSVRPKSGGVNLDALEEHFATRCRAVTRVPYDPHLELGAEVDLAELAPPTRDALLELAANVAAGFPQPSGPVPPPMQMYDGPR